MSVRVLVGDCRETLRGLAADSVHCCVTSPPYYGLRDYGHAAQIGLEQSPAEYVAQMVAVFSEVRRALRPDGTLWLNLGDSYGAGTRGRADKQDGGGLYSGPQNKRSGVAPVSRGGEAKQLLGIPWRVAFALQEDGWYLRQDIIWAKPNPMPESVRDRCTKAHEYVFLMSKAPRYYYDSEAIKEPSAQPHGAPRLTGQIKAGALQSLQSSTLGTNQGEPNRNRRSVWTVTPKPFRGAHFAVMPPELVRPCILAGTSARGACPHCGAPWERIVERERVPTRPGADTKVTGDTLTDGNRDPERHCTRTVTTGWRAGCECAANVPVPATVLDPFGGSGTTGAAAIEEGRAAILCELNPAYAPLIEARLSQAKRRE